MKSTNVQHDRSPIEGSTAADTDVSLKVVEAVAEATDTDPVALSPPLFEVIDTDALDQLFANGSPTRVVFEYAGHTVVVHEDETITVA